MKSQKYRRSLGRGRLSRNVYNLSNLTLSTKNLLGFLKTPLKFDCPHFGPVIWDKAYRGPEITSSITKEFKDQFSAHQVIKTFYGDLNKHQISSPLPSLEDRLDVLVYRTGKPLSLFQARTWIRHGKVLVIPFRGMGAALPPHIPGGEPMQPLICRDVSWKVPVGSDILIQSSPSNKPGPGQGMVATPPAKNPPHLWVKHIDKTTTLAIFKKPIIPNQIRYPKGFSFEKYPSKAS